MNIRNLLAASAATGMLLVGATAVADDDDEKQAVQVVIDAQSGRKLAHGAADDVTPTHLANGDSIDLVMPEDAQLLQESDDGSMSAMLGQKQLRYLVATVDENGDVSIDHSDSAEPSVEETASTTEEQ